jgi:hypothetical protein
MSVSARKHKKDKRAKKASSKVTSDEEHEPVWRPQRVDSAPSDLDPLRKAPQLTRSSDLERRPSSAPGSGLINAPLLPSTLLPNPQLRSTSPPVLSPKGARPLEHEVVSVPVLPSSKRAQLAEQQTAQLLEVLKYPSRASSVVPLTFHFLRAMQDLSEALRQSEARLARMEQQLQSIETRQRFQMTIISLIVLLGQYLWSCMSYHLCGPKLILCRSGKELDTWKDCFHSSFSTRLSGSVSHRNLRSH